ncbi:MAG: ribonuclease H-like domain-containing protein [Clostridia bacterium]|nr:ribonuclease H-like domain-containing protein [Clostridia bacterium]
MITVKETVKTEYFRSKIFSQYFGDMKIAAFDIETMGLSARNSELVLSCFMEVSEDGTGYVTQYFLEDPLDEVLLMEKTIDELKKYDAVITYNGNTFDIPFVKERAKRLGIDKEFHVYNLDLFPCVQHYSDLRNVLTGLRQKDIERYLRISEDREDTISGKESVELFRLYLDEPKDDLREEYKKKILTHNFEDVTQLYRIMKILKELDFHRSRARMGFPVKTALLKPVHIMRTELKNQQLIISGRFSDPDFTYISFENGETEFRSDGTFSIKIPVEKHAKAQFINLRRFGPVNGNLSSLKGYENGYLILKNEDTYWQEMNLLAKDILIKTIEKVTG